MATSAAAAPACSGTMRGAARSPLTAVVAASRRQASRSPPPRLRAGARVTLSAPTAPSRGRHLSRRWWAPQKEYSSLQLAAALRTASTSTHRAERPWCCVAGASTEHTPGQPGGQLSAGGGHEERITGEPWNSPPADLRREDPSRGRPIWPAARRTPAEQLLCV